MSEEQLKAFLEKVKGDTSLQEKLKAAAFSEDAVLAIAKDAGFSISADDLKNAQSEISDEELEGVAGGFVPSMLPIQLPQCGVFWGKIGGGGASDRSGEFHYPT